MRVLFVAWFFLLETGLEIEDGRSQASDMLAVRDLDIVTLVSVMERDFSLGCLADGKIFRIHFSKDRQFPSSTISLSLDAAEDSTVAYLLLIPLLMYVSRFLGGSLFLVPALALFLRLLEALVLALLPRLAVALVLALFRRLVLVLELFLWLMLVLALALFLLLELALVLALLLRLTLVMILTLFLRLVLALLPTMVLAVLILALALMSVIVSASFFTATKLC